jgi:hypothetical protein
MPVDNRTMEIGTPIGFINRPLRPPRRPLWPFLLGGSLFVVAVVVAIVAAQGGGDDGAATGSPAAGAPAAGSAAPPAQRVAHVQLTTRPSGAEIIDGAGRSLGTTPTTIELPVDGHEVVLTFRHPQASERQKRFVPEGDTAIDIELPPLAAAAPDAGPPPPSTRSSAHSSHHKTHGTHHRDGEILRPF